MRVSKVLIPLLLITIMSAGCDDNNNGANAQDPPGPGETESSTVVTGSVQAQSEQGCPRLIDGLMAGDNITLQIESDSMKSGMAKITNSNTGDEADCAGDVDEFPPAAIMSCKASSSTIPGIKSGDELELSVAFSAQTREVSLANISSSDGITCAFLTLDTLSAM